MDNIHIAKQEKWRIPVYNVLNFRVRYREVNMLFSSSVQRGKYFIFEFGTERWIYYFRVRYGEVNIFFLNSV